MTIEATGSRPTLDANGFIGGFTGEGEKTVIPAHASAKVSLRLVPDQDPAAIVAALTKQIQSLTTPGVEIKIDVLGSSPPVTCGVDNPAAHALRSAFSDVFGRDTALERVGGSIPVSLDFQKALGAPLLISGIAQADAAAHSPNERLDVDQYLRGIEAVIRFICRLGDQSPQQ
jgi:acetylornithine deacetylase/succinyl-diaminopimelate desuccinylase-like protein